MSFRTEYLYAFDFVCAVLHRYTLWYKPISLLSRTASELSHCSRPIRRCVRKLLDNSTGTRASFLFDEWFENRPINLENCVLFVKYATVEFCLIDYNPKDFLECSAILVEFSALAYIYGVKAAPEYAIFCVTHMLCYYKNKNQFKDSSWCELKRYARRLA